MFNLECVTQISENKPSTDMQSLVVQYENPNDLYLIQEYIRSKRKNTSHTIINKFIEIDGFVNLDYNTSDLGINRCVRIIYECLCGNDKPSPFNDRFPDCNIIRIDVNKLKQYVAEENERWRQLPHNI